MCSSLLFAADAAEPSQQDVDNLKKPLYNPFIERYVIDELKQLRIDMNQLRVDMTKEVVDRELEATTIAVSYASNTVTYFFYLIAGVSSILVIIGWNSMRDIKEKVQNFADEKVNQVILEYEQRLENLEEELNRKSKGIKNAQNRINQHQDIHSLWLKAGQETVLSNRIAIYDQILKLDPENAEAMTYKADIALEMNEPEWAINLCNQALTIDAENKHAFYQLAGAYALLERPGEAIEKLKMALDGSDGYREQVKNDPIFESLHDNENFQNLINDEKLISS
jgi:tetratricopeptide (TPR) repeat protein